MPVSIELSKQTRAEAITSIQRYFQENMSEPIGNMAADYGRPLCERPFLFQGFPLVTGTAAQSGQRWFPANRQTAARNFFADFFPGIQNRRHIGPSSTINIAARSIRWTSSPVGILPGIVGISNVSHTTSD